MNGKAVVKFSAVFAYVLIENLEFMEESMNRKLEGGGFPILLLVKILLFSYIITGLMLMLLALLLLNFNLGVKAVTGAVIAIYVIATFFAGMIIGKRMDNRKYLWGMLEGLAYFVVLALISLIAGKDGFAPAGSVLTTLALCVCGGTMGGMVS